MNNNMYAMLFLLVITTTISSVLCSSSNNKDGEIFMVVEEKTSYVEPGFMAQNPSVQLGRFGSKDGKKFVTLSRPVKNGKENCVGPEGDPCGALDHCCEGLYCDGIFNGRCHVISDCLPQGSVCSTWSQDCCYPYQCNHPGPVHGIICG